MQDLRLLIQQHYENLSSGDIAAEDTLFCPEVVTVEPAAGTIRGLDAFKAYVQALRTAFPDGQHRLTSIVEFCFADFFEVEGGRIVKHRLYYDQVTFLTQLGLMPGPT